MHLFKTEVIKGLGIGEKFGFPTINLQIPEKFDLKDGVYLAELLPDKKKYPCLIFFGERKTLKISGKSLEAFLFEQIDKPKTVVQVRILKFLREIKDFLTHSSLKKQIFLDIEEAKKFFKEN